MYAMEKDRNKDTNVLARNTTKCLVVLILSAGVFIALSNASCYYALPPALDKGEKLEGCLHNGKLFELDTKWRDDNCLDCSCNKKGMKMCCSNANRPTQYDSERCFCKLNKETCKYELISKTDPEERCLPYGSVG
ncbi:beta-microseminoprotein-like [Anomaloglossus baeobatrachus]|uniref:beta-microseminoprotein-like n=1 Tax=Anomaloglossus baeobatrachus TaxID=238106 RepID=UPI003F5060F0